MRKAFHRVKFKSVQLKEYSKKDVKLDMHLMFWCTRYMQYVCFAACVSRYHKREELGFNLCHNCPIRRATFRKFRVPRIIVRFPRETQDDQD